MATEKKKQTKPVSAMPAASVQAVKEPVADARNRLERRKAVVGTVVSDKMQKTIVVKVDRRVRHGFYKKYVLRSQRYKAHDETNNAKIGDLVSLVESRPLSRDKRWVLREIIRRAEQSVDANV